MASHPLLLVDVDGVISLFGFDRARPPAGDWTIVDGIPHYLSATAGEHLRTLARAYELVWCTGWEEKANDYLPHALGLAAELPVLSFEGEVAAGAPIGSLPPSTASPDLSARSRGSTTATTRAAISGPRAVARRRSWSGPIRPSVSPRTTSARCSTGVRARLSRP